MEYDNKNNMEINTDRAHKIDLSEKRISHVTTGQKQ
jgi:hypothetical protein